MNIHSLRGLFALFGVVAGHGYMDYPSSRQKLHCGFSTVCRDDRETPNPKGTSYFPGPVAGRAPGKGVPTEPFCVGGKSGSLSAATVKALNEPGPVQATWNAGDVVELKWRVVANHRGKYTYRLCLDGSDTEACFEQTPLLTESGEQWIDVPEGASGTVFKDRLVIPDVSCDRCTLAFRWDGLQENSVFAQCADVSISGGAPPPDPVPGPSPPVPSPQPASNPFMINSLLNDGLCLDLLGDSTENGNAVGIWECNGHESQNWWFQDWKIMYGPDNSKCIDVPGDYDYQGGEYLWIWDCNGSPGQTWGYDPSTNNIYLADASLCLDIPSGDQTLGTSVQIWECNGMAQQAWYVPPGFGTFNIATMIDGWKCLDLPGGDTSNGNILQIWDCNGKDGQQWVWSDENQIQYMKDPSKCVDVPGGDLSGATFLWLWDCNGSQGQYFGYDWDQGTIYFSASSSDASTCVDLVGGDTTNGNEIQTWECNGYNQQKWTIGSQGQAKLESLRAAKGAISV